MPSSALECLPTELLIAITDHLPTGYSVLLLRHVSKTLYDILSSHDVVSHALIAHYPHSAESRYELRDRTKEVFDAVVRRSYTQPRRRNPRETSELHCYPLFFSQEDQVLAYQTREQKLSVGWDCTLWDIRHDKEVVVELEALVGGCYNEHGQLFGSAVLRDVWCQAGRGVMVVGGRHKHTLSSNPQDMEQGLYTDEKIELGYYGIHIAPRLCRHQHTFFHIYSLHSETLGHLISSFSFYGTTSLTHTAANTSLFTSLSAGSLFIYTLQPAQFTTPLAPGNVVKAKPPALWRDFAYSTTTTGLTIDTLGKYLFVYNDPGVGGFYDRGNGSVIVVSATTGNTLKKVILADSRPLFEYRLERDDSRLWEWRFERSCTTVSRPRPPQPTHPASSSSSLDSQDDGEAIEFGEEVMVSWTGSYGVYGTRGTRVGLDGLDMKHRFTGERTPVMIEWRINTFPATAEDDVHGGREKVKPTLYFVPSEHHGDGGGGVMAVPTLLLPYEDLVQREGFVRWPVAVCSYTLMEEGSGGGMLKWGGGEGRYYTSSGKERVCDEGRAITLWFQRGVSEPWAVNCGDDMLFPKWKEVLEVEGKVDNSWVFEGCGWMLYRIVKKRDWRKEEMELEKARARGGMVEVEIVEYDDSDVEMEMADEMEAEVEDEVQDEARSEEEFEEDHAKNGVTVRGIEGVGDKFVLLRF